MDSDQIPKVKQTLLKLKERAVYLRQCGADDKFFVGGRVIPRDEYLELVDADIDFGTRMLSDSESLN